MSRKWDPLDKASFARIVGAEKRAADYIQKNVELLAAYAVSLCNFVIRDFGKLCTPVTYN